MRLNDLPLDELTVYVKEKYGKSFYHSELVFRQLYSEGRSDPAGIKGLSGSVRFAEEFARDIPYTPPEIAGILEAEGTVKFLVKLEDGTETESVIVPMRNYSTLCVSSQIGCGRNCRFCETGKRGLVRNLSSGEIVNQVMAAVFCFKAPLRNLVFMGMGEPFDNFENVVKAVDIVSDVRGLNIPKKHISLSTAGHVDGIGKLSDLCRRYPERSYHTMHLSVSLNAADSRLRNELMPINRQYPLSALKKALEKAPQCRLKDALYFEYIVIPGINDSPEHAQKLLDFTEGLSCKINIIPYNPGTGSLYRKPDKREIDIFWETLKRGGRQCRTRFSRGENIGAACGQLGRALSNLPEGPVSAPHHPLYAERPDGIPRSPL